MSIPAFSIDKILYDVLTERADQGITLSELRVEYSARSGEDTPPPNRELFWRIYMHIQALKTRKLVRRVERPEGGGVFFVEEQFNDYPLELVDRLLIRRCNY